MNEPKPKAENPIIQCIEGVRGYVDADGVVQLNLEDIARGLGFTQTKGNVKYIRWKPLFDIWWAVDFPNLLGKTESPCLSKTASCLSTSPSPFSTSSP